MERQEIQGQQPQQWCTFCICNVVVCSWHHQTNQFGLVRENQVGLWPVYVRAAGLDLHINSHLYLMHGTTWVQWLDVFGTQSCLRGVVHCTQNYLQRASVPRVTRRP